MRQGWERKKDRKRGTGIGERIHGMRDRSGREK